MNRHSLQRIILEELSSSRKVKKLKLSEALGDAGHSLLMKLDDGIFVHDNSLMFEQPSADPSIGGGPTGYEEVDAPQPAKYPTPAAVDEPDPEDDLVKAAKDAESASKAREEEIEAARASASAAGAPAGSAPAPAAGAPGGESTLDPLISIISRGAEEERKKRGRKGAPPATPAAGEEPAPADVDKVPAGGSSAGTTDSEGPGEPESEEDSPPASNARAATQFIDDAIASYKDPGTTATVSEMRYRRSHRRRW